MSDLIRLGDDGKPLDDTWSNYNRAHAWTGWIPVHEEGVPPQWGRADIWCRRCHQTRRVWGQVPMKNIRWGCPRVPLLYVIRMWLRGTDIPPWSVNSRPPWLAS